MSTTSKKLLDILNGLPEWPRFPNETSEWSREQIEARFPAWDLLPDSIRREIPVLHKDTWIVIGAGAFALVHEGSPTPIVGNLRLAGAEAREIVVRLQNRPAGILPPPTVLEELVDTWRQRAAADPARQPDVVVRNELQERIAAVAPFVGQVRRLIDQAKREVIRAGGDPGLLDGLVNDPFVHDLYVDVAYRELNKVPMVDSDHAHQTVAAAAGQQVHVDDRRQIPVDAKVHLVTVEEAANRLSIPSRTIRNWIQRKSDPLAPVDARGGPRGTARRYRLRDIQARMPPARS